MGDVLFTVVILGLGLVLVLILGLGGKEKWLCGGCWWILGV